MQDGDYSWNEGSAPTNAGSYMITLNKVNILQHLQAKIAADSVWNGNVDLKDADLSGSAAFTINKIAGTVSLSGNDGKTYDGTAGTIDPSKASFSLNGENLQSPTGSNALTADDFAWADGTAPINYRAGGYQIILKQSGIDKLQAANPNYNLTFAGGQIVYMINKAQAAATLSGSDGKIANGAVGTIDPSKAHWQLPTSLQLPTDLTAADFQWTNAAGQLISAPSQAGTYYIRLNDAGLQKFQQANPNYQVSVSGAITYVLTAPDQPVFPDNPIIPDNPIVPINPINQEKQEDLIFVTPTGRIVCRLANGIIGLANHDLTQAKVISLINKYLPQGWQLPTGFVVKAIQVNGLASFITVVPAKAQTTVYLVLSNGKIIKKTVWKVNASQASQKQRVAFAKANLPAGYQLVGIGQSHSVDQGKEALFITVAPKRAIAPKSEQSLVFTTQTGQRIKTVSNDPAIAPKHITDQQVIQKYVPKGYQLTANHSTNPIKMNDHEILVLVVPDKEQK